MSTYSNLISTTYKRKYCYKYSFFIELKEKSFETKFIFGYVIISNNKTVTTLITYNDFINTWECKINPLFYKV